MSSSATISAEPLRRADEREMVELGPARPRVRVDEADEVDAVLRMLEQLPRRQLADVARADDDRVLEVQRAAPGDRARDARAPATTSTDGEQPEHDEPRDVQIADAGGPRRHEVAPRAERDEMEDADDLVDRRMVDVLLVPLVEPVELRCDDPERKHRARARRTEGRGASPGVPPETISFARTIGEDEAREVRAEQRAPDEPAAVTRGGRSAAWCRSTPPAFEDRRGPLVESQRVEVDPKRGGLLERAHARCLRGIRCPRPRLDMAHHPVPLPSSPADRPPTPQAEPRSGAHARPDQNGNTVRRGGN